MQQRSAIRSATSATEERHMETLSWHVALPAVGAAFLASLVEVVEAFTIVLAVGTTRGWRPALQGSLAGLARPALRGATVWPALGQPPLHWLQLAIGILLLLFGLRWLRKAILRAAAIIPLHDEAAAFAAETAELGQAGSRRGRRGGWVAGTGRFQGRRPGRARGCFHRDRRRRGPRPAAAGERRSDRRLRAGAGHRPCSPSPTGARARERVEVRRRNPADGVRGVLDRRGAGDRLAGWRPRDPDLHRNLSRGRPA